MGPGVANGVVILPLTVFSHAVLVDGSAAQEIDRSLDSLARLRRSWLRVAVVVALTHWLGAGPTVVLVQRTVSTFGSGRLLASARGCGEAGKQLPKWLATGELRCFEIDPGYSDRWEGGG